MQRASQKYLSQTNLINILHAPARESWSAKKLAGRRCARRIEQYATSVVPALEIGPRALIPTSFRVPCAPGPIDKGPYFDRRARNAFVSLRSRFRLRRKYHSSLQFTETEQVVCTGPRLRFHSTINFQSEF